MAAALPKIPAGGRSETAAPATLFALLFAVAVLLHIVWPPVFQIHPPFPPPPTWLLTGLVLAAVAVIHRPASVGRLLCLAAVQILDVAYYLPFVPNHWLLTGILSLAILGAAGVVAVRARFAAVQLGDLYQTLTPSVRISAAVFYFFTFFHKLNADFLNPDVSCAVRFFEQTVSPFGLAALPGAGRAVIWGTLTAELALAVGLAIPRWQKAACVLGAGFHLLLALDAPHIFYNFSSVMFAVLWVCLPASTAAEAARQTGILPRFAFLSVYLLLVLLFWAWPAYSWKLMAYGFSALWLGWALILLNGVGLGQRRRLFLFARTARRSSPAPGPAAPVERFQGRRYAGVLLLLPALVFINGASPYLGLKTRTAWQMYSNLMLSPYDSNHYLIPFSLDLGGFMADAVRLTATTDPTLESQYMQTGQLITWHELRRHVAQHPEDSACLHPDRPPTQSVWAGRGRRGAKSAWVGGVGKTVNFSAARPTGRGYLRLVARRVFFPF